MSPVRKLVLRGQPLVICSFTPSPRHNGIRTRFGCALLQLAYHVYILMDLTAGQCQSCCVKIKGLFSSALPDVGVRLCCQPGQLQS